MLFGKSSKEAPEKKAGIFSRMKQALGATKNSLVARIEAVLTSKSQVDEEILEEIEGVLLGADIGIRATTRILKEIRERCKSDAIKTPEDVRASIRTQLLAILETRDTPKSTGANSGPEVWMIVGVNGTGKTTTVGKLAARLSQEGNKVLVCAADTFRPAAIEQLSVWAERSGSDLVKSRQGADPAAVLHDALSAAVSRRAGIVLVDTAGRLHTRGNLMQELDKMRRVAGRIVPGAPHEVLLVMDATTGQNGLAQAMEFTKSVGVTGIIVTKLDGTAKGGVLVGIVQDLGIPVRYVGVGESLDDLLEFSAANFVDSLFS